MAARLKFRHVEAFRAVLQTGTATGAASLLNVTQPAVSQLVSEMEAVAGLSLFDRRGGRLAPTQDALLLFDEVERCYTGLDQINAYCDRLRSSQARSLVLTAAPSLALTLVPRAIGRYIREVRRDFFTVLPRHSNEAIRMVGSGKADIGFGSTLVSAPGVACEPISRYEAVCALPKNHPLCAKNVIHARDLDGQPFIVLSRSEGVHDVVEEMFEREGVTVSPVAECPMTTAACSLVEAGVGLTLVEHGAAAFAREGAIELRRFEPAVPVSFYAYFLTCSEAPSWRSRFMEVLQKEADLMRDFIDARVVSERDRRVGTRGPTA